MKQKLTRQTLRGVWPALLTPWTEDDRIDVPRLRQEIQHIASSGAHGTYTGGTAGEFYAQDDATFAQLTEIVCQEAQRIGLAVQIGCSALSTRMVRQRIRIALEHGANGIQFTLPFWLALDDAEVVQFFADIADAAGDTPLIYYQTTRAKRRIDPPVLGQIYRQFPTFIGMKDTGCSLEILKLIIDDAPELAVFGTDADCLERVRVGARGSYSSVAGLSMTTMLAIYEHSAAGRFDEAEPYQDSVRRLMHEVLLPIVREKSLMDSAIDRVQRVAGGGEVGLRCQSPYKSATEGDVRTVIDWCRRAAPDLLSG